MLNSIGRLALNLSKSMLGVVVGIFCFNLAYITVGWIRNNDVGLNGNFRKDFVEAAVPSCFERQRSDPLNRGASDEVIIEFCNCYAAGLADKFSINELKSLASGAVNKKVQSITRACANDLNPDIAKGIEHSAVQAN